ncbi:MAG TPA: M6 family metalloprotease domain-containing protein [bacterium]
MKPCTTALTVLLLFCLTSVLPVSAMPPHPDLLQKIRSHEVAAPYYLQHYQQIQSRGVESPTRRPLVDMLRQRSLDEDINMIAILVDFSDHGAHTDPVGFDSLLFGANTGTLRNYYSQVSYGNLTLVTLNMPSALEWQRAPHTYSYYVDGQNGFGSYPQNAQRLAEDAVNLVDPLVDFSQYDNDGDGHVDALFIIHTGPGAERTGRGSDIWSHKWQMQNPPQVDGVTADVYSMEPEYWDVPGDMTCGVYAHEMGHSVFGLPDLYDYDYDSEGVGNWSLMAGGSWNGGMGSLPSHPDAWSRIRMGFVNATNLTSNVTRMAIPSVEATPQIFRMWTDGQQGSEYFLVENRQQEGYDRGLPSGGLMIWHVDDQQYGNDHQWYPGYTDQGHYHVALEQADGFWNLEHNAGRGDAGDPYPGALENHIFNVNSAPSSEAYDLSDSHVSVRHISASADTMYAGFYVSSSPDGNPAFVWMPDTSVVAGSDIVIPVGVENDLNGRNVTSLQFTVHFDSTLFSAVAPYVIRGGLVPQSWNLTATPASGSLTVNASGSAPLSGNGTMLSLQLHAARAAQDNSCSALTFAGFTLNQGVPAVDTTNGRVYVMASRIVFTPVILDLDVARVGSTEVYDAFVIRNTGSADLVLDSLHIPGFITTDFHGPRTVGPNRWYPVRVQFAPTEPRLFEDTLIVYSSDYTSPNRMPVHGRGGVPALTASATSVNFDTVEIGQQGVRTLQLADSGYWPTAIQSLRLAAGLVFSVADSTRPATVPARGERTLSLVFAPTAGVWSDTLIITHDAGEPLRVVLHGVGAVLRTDDPNGTALPTAFGLSSNFPNPFNATTVLTYAVPRAAWVTLTVYDVLGREVDAPVKGMAQAGRYTIRWGCSECGSGIYFFVLSAGGVRLTQKAMLLR